MEQTLGSQNPQKTILIVDDDPVVLKMVAAMLDNGAYTVLTADNGNEAIQKSKDYKPEIHLLLSDFQMPEMSGVDLATHLSLERPALKVLLMSGFTDGMLVLNEGWHFLAKPFIPSQLRALVTGLVFPDKSSRFIQQ
jgi:two-component system, cell cycle sensor histidine kinase and response regulator CckA